MRLIYKVAISVALILITLWIANPSDLIDALQDVKWQLIGFVVILYLINLCVKAYRWSIIIRSANARVPYLSALKSFTLCQAINNVTPGRVAGEAARVFNINRDNGVQIGSGVATVATERTMDLVAVTVLGIIGLFFLTPLLLEGTMEAMILVFIVAIAINAFIIYALARPGLIERVANWTSRQIRKVLRGKTGAKLGDQIVTFGASFKTSLMLQDSSRKKALWGAAGLTALIWGNECLRFILILMALDTEVNLAAVLVVVSISSLSAIVLVAGSSNLVTATSVLVVTGVDLEVATTAGLLSAMTSIWLSLPLGIIAIVLMGRDKKAKETSNPNKETKTDKVKES